MADEAPKMTFDDWQGVTAVLYEWADSYDAKDWERLRRIIAPELLVDYTNVSGQKWEAMQPDEYIAMVSDEGFMGDPLVQMQHLIGMSKWQKRSDDFIIGYHQLRVGTVRFQDTTQTTEEMKGHSHASNTHYYRKVDGVWKFAGLRPEVRWNEYDFEHVFKGFEAPTRR